jgi:pSer/pThr/pTyr-binding forkhead associated (FHA) protein
MPPSPPPAPAVVAEPPTNASAPATTAGAWELVVAVDPALDIEPDPSAPCPANTQERVVPVDRDLLIGREDDRRDIHPDLAVADPGASRRHAKIVHAADGTLALQDLASTNGTKLNAVDVAAGSRQALRDGDQITLGRWTRITIRRGLP